MTCDELKEEYGAYALGVAADPEKTEITQHLARQCPACTAGVRGPLGTVTTLANAVKPVDPPKRLRKRIIALVRTDPDRGWFANFLPWVVAAGLTVALVSVVVNDRARPSESKLDQALSILNDPTTKDVSFGEPSARGRVFVSPGKGVVFIAAHLPSVEAGKTFELWVIPAAGAPIPAGTFDSEKDSTAVYVRQGPVDNAAAMAVTIEPQGGSAQPTTKPFIIAKL